MEKNLRIEISRSKKQKYKFIVNINKFTLLKLFFVFLILILITFNTLYGIGLPKDNLITCIYDRGFNLTNTINQYMQRYPLFRYSVLGFGSILIDIVFIFSLIYWAMRGKTWRFPITMGLFYGVRGLVQRIYIMNFPEGYCWEFPFVPSLVVNYLKTNDFFFSGHVGMPIIAGLELYKSNMKLFAYFCLITACYEGFLVLISRVHYSIDIIVGFVFSHYCFIIVDDWAKSVLACISQKRDLKLKEAFHETNQTEKGESKEGNSNKQDSKENVINIVHTETHVLTRV